MPDDEEETDSSPKGTDAGVADEGAGGSGSGTDVRTFLIADVRGYTKYTQEHGDEAAAALASTFADLVREVVEKREGFLIELRGDEALVAFVSARQALRAAVELQARFTEAGLPRGVGIGLDSGEAIPVGQGYRGGALNLAARLCAQAKPGQILASEGVIHLAAKVDGLSYVDPRTFRLKGYAEPVRAVEVVPEGRARRGSLQRFGVQTRRAARRPVFWATAAAALVVIVVLAVALPKALSGKSSPASSPTGPAAALASNMLVRVDTGLNRVVASIPVGKAPSAVTTGAGSVWVTNAADGSVSRIDPVTNKVTAVIRVGSEPAAIGFDGNDIWVANRLSRTLSHIDPGSNKVIGEVSVPANPVSVAFGTHSVFVGSQVNRPALPQIAKAPVVRIDPNSSRADDLALINGSVCSAVATGNGAVWAIGEIGQVLEWDPSTGRELGRAQLGQRTLAVVVGDEGVWVATPGFPGDAKLLDLASLRVIANVPVGSTPRLANEEEQCGGRQSSSMAEGNGFLWVTNVADGTITQIDVESRHGVATVNVGKTPTGVALGFGSVWVTVTGG